MPTNFDPRLLASLLAGEDGPVTPRDPSPLSVSLPTQQQLEGSVTPVAVPTALPEVEQTLGGRIQGALNNLGNTPVALNAIAQFGAALAGPGSFAERLAGVSQQLTDQTQGSEYFARLLAGDSIQDIERAPGTRGVSPEVRQQAITLQGQQQELALRERGVRVQELSQAATEAYQQGTLTLQQAEQQLRARLADLGFEQQELDRALDVWKIEQGLEAGERERESREQIAAQNNRSAERRAGISAGATRYAADRSLEAALARQAGAAGGGLQDLTGTMANIIQDQVMRETSQYLQGTTLDALRGVMTGGVDFNTYYNSLSPEGKAVADERLAQLEAQARTGGGLLGLNATPPADASAPVDVATEADAANLPSGTRFRLPDGRTGTVR